MLISLIICIVKSTTENELDTTGFCMRKEDCENDLHLFATNVSAIGNF